MASTSGTKPTDDYAKEFECVAGSSCTEMTVGCGVSTTAITNVDEMPYIPEELLIYEIVTRVPVKSVLRFRCVSKIWCGRIGEKKFIKAHEAHSLMANHTSLLFSGITGFQTCSLNSLYNDPFTDTVASNVDTVGAINVDEINWLGCCRGWACIMCDSSAFFLYNPATRETFKLPHWDEEFTDAKLSKWGFGYDDLTDDYKVYGEIHYIDESGLPDDFGKLYSFADNSWEESGVNSYGAPSFGLGGTHMNGIIHWLYNDGIWTYNLNSMEWVGYDDPEVEGAHSLAIIDGCLVMIKKDYKNRVCVFTNGNYGETEPWSQLCFVGKTNIPLFRNTFPLPLGVGLNGEILINYSGYLVVFEKQRRGFSRPQIRGIGRFLEVGFYIENLVSVDPVGNRKLMSTTENHV